MSTNKPTKWERAAIKHCGYHAWMCGDTGNFETAYKLGYQAAEKRYKPKKSAKHNPITGKVEWK